jgi:hypothetical protein
LIFLKGVHLSRNPPSISPLLPQIPPIS